MLDDDDATTMKVKLYIYICVSANIQKNIHTHTTLPGDAQKQRIKAYNNNFVYIFFSCKKRQFEKHSSES